MSLASEREKIEHEILSIISGGMAEPRMVIVGCGGAGCGTVGRIGQHLKGVPRVAINTDMSGLMKVDADKKICIGRSITFGSDSGGFTEVAERCAELGSEDIRSCLISKDIAFIVTGLGGGTGGAIAPMVAEMAKGLGMVAFGIGILPFSVEEARRARGQEQADTLRRFTDSTIILDNDKLLKFGDAGVDQAFHVMDRMVVQIIRDVSDTVGRSYLAALAGEVMAYQSDMEMVSVHTGASGMGQNPEAGAVAAGYPGMSSVAPLPEDLNLIEMGGMFQRF